MAEASIPLLLLQMYQVSLQCADLKFLNLKTFKILLARKKSEFMPKLAPKTMQAYLICTATDIIWCLFIF